MFSLNSEAQPKGSDCYDVFKTMQDCMGNYPGVYKQSQPDDDEEEGGMDLAAMIDEEEDAAGQSPKEEEPSNQSEVTGAGTSAAVAQKAN